MFSYLSDIDISAVMPMCRLLILSATFLSLARGADAETWFASPDPYSAPKNLMLRSTYMDLFEPSQTWRVDVFKASTQFLLRAKDEEIVRMLEVLRSRNMKLAMEGLMLVVTDRCGKGIEGYEGLQAIPRVAKRVIQLGGVISYVAMDEPLTFGHFSNRKDACQDSVESLAQQLAPNVAALKAAFPKIQIGDIEPLDDRTADRIDAMVDFINAFKRATGEPLAFYHADVHWHSQWRPQLAIWKQRFHAVGARLGVIFNGDGRDDDLRWTDNAVQRFRAVTTDRAVSPDDAIFQSWDTAPSIGPDADPHSLTGMVKRIQQGRALQ
jgi:hypothetical protein